MSKTDVETAEPQIMYFDPSVRTRKQSVRWLLKGLVLVMPDHAFVLSSKGVISALNILLQFNINTFSVSFYLRIFHVTM